MWAGEMETSAPLCHCVSPCQTPLHYLWRSPTPVPVLPHHMANFIASICFCFLDFPSESMFIAWVAIFYVLWTSRQILHCHPLSPFLLLLFIPSSPPHPHPNTSRTLTGLMLFLQRDGICSLHVISTVLLYSFTSHRLYHPTWTTAMCACQLGPLTQAIYAIVCGHCTEHYI